MATVREIVTRALRRIREIGSGETATADDAALALDALNGMIAGWPALGVSTIVRTYALNDTFSFFVPPAEMPGEAITDLAYIGTWDADDNEPLLESGVGLIGETYRVSVAGNTPLNDVSDWDVGDYATFDGVEWRKGIDSSRFNSAVVDMLAVEICLDFGKEPPALLMRTASRGWVQIQAAFIKPPTALLDRAIRDTYQRVGIAELMGTATVPSAALLDDDGQPLSDP